MAGETFSGIIESFIKPEALKEFDTLGSKLDASLEGFDKVIAKAALLSTEIKKSGSAYSQYISNSKEIANVNKELASSQQNINSNISSYNKLLNDVSKSIKDNTGATDDQARRLIALRTELSKAKDAVATYQKLIREVNKENPAQLSDKTFNEVFNAFGSETANGIRDAFNSLDNATKGEFIQQLTEDAARFLEIQKQLEQEIKTVASAINFQSKEAAANAGSIDQLSARLEALQKAYRGLSEEDRNSSVGQNLKAQIDVLDPQVKELEKSIGITRRLVGDYANQISQGLSPAFATLNTLLQENNALIKDSAKFNQLSAEAQQQLVTETESLNVLLQKSVASIGDLTAQNNALQKTLVALEQANLKGSESYKIIQAELVKGRKAVGDLRQEVKALQSDTRALDQAVGVASALVAVYQTGAAAAQLFGNETEDTQKAIAKLVAVQSVLNGLQTIQQQLTQKGTALNKLYAFSMQQISIATDASASATARFRAVLATTLIGALVIAVGFLVNKMIELSTATDASAQAYENLKQRMEDVRAETQRLINDSQNLTNVEVARLRSIGGTDVEIFEAQKKALLERRKLLRDEQFSIQSEIGKIFPFINEDKKAAEAYKQLRDQSLENEKQFYDNEAQLQILSFNFAEAQRNKNLAAAKKYADDIKQLNEQEARAALELFKFRKEQEIKAAQDVVSNDLFSINARIDARQRIADAQKSIVIAEYNFAIQYSKLTQSGLLLEAEKRTAKEAEILENSLRDQLQLRIKYAQRFKEADASTDNLFFNQNSVEKQIADLITAYERRRSIVETNTDNELTQLENARREGIITEEKYNVRRAEIEKESALKLLEIDLEYAKKKLEILKASGVDTTKELREIARIEREIAEARSGIEGTANNKSGNQSGKTPEQERIEQLEQLKQKYYELAQALKDTVFAFIDAQFINQKNAIQEQIDLIDIRRAKEIEAVNATTASNEDKAARIKIIEASAQAQREQLERRQRQIDLERARFQRAQQVAAIIGNTAQAITKTLAEGGPFAIPLTVIIGAIGALQLATLLATPLPKFLHGKNDDYEGWATVSEDGRPELYIDKSRGVVGMTPAKPSLMYVSKESSIIPAPKVQEFLQYSGMGYVPRFEAANSTAQPQFNDANMVNAIKNKKMQQVVIIHNNLGWYDDVKRSIFK